MHTRLSSRNRVISECIDVIYCRLPAEKKKRIPMSRHENDELSASRPLLIISHPALKFLSSRMPAAKKGLSRLPRPNLVRPSSYKS